jgi:hypothetical protein
MEKKSSTGYHHRRVAASDCICDAAVPPDPRLGDVKNRPSPFNNWGHAHSADRVLKQPLWRARSIRAHKVAMMATRTKARLSGISPGKALKVSLDNAKRPFPHD